LNQTVEIKLKKTGEELNWICVFKVFITFWLLLTPRVQQMNFTWTFKKEWRRKKMKKKEMGIGTYALTLTMARTLTHSSLLSVSVGLIVKKRPK
jgi:hypothetical protein